MVNSKSINALAAALLLSLSGCATLERHPVLTAIGTAIIVGSIAAIAEHRHDQHPFNPCGAGRRIHPEAPFYGDCH